MNIVNCIKTVLLCYWTSWPPQMQQKGQESPACLSCAPPTCHEHCFEAKLNSPVHSTWTSNRPTSSGIADTHMLNVVVCLASLHKRIHNCCTTLNGLNSNHRAVSMNPNLTSIKYKAKLSMNCSNIEFVKRMNNVSFPTSIFWNSPPGTRHTIISARQSYALARKLLLPLIANVKGVTRQAKAF
jgi:hypothetical protein